MACTIAVAGGAVIATALGFGVATGIIELVTAGGNLVLAVQREQQDRCKKLMDHVQKQIGKDLQTWLKRDCKEDWDKRIEIEQALAGLDDIVAHIKPTVRDIIDAGYNGELLFSKMTARLPEGSEYRRDGTARRVLQSLIINTFVLVRSDETFHRELTSLSFERLFGEIGGLKGTLDEVARNQLEHRLENKRQHEEVLQAIAADKGVPADNLRPLFEAVSREVPEGGDIRAAVLDAVNELIARAKAVRPPSGSKVVDRAYAKAKTKLESLDLNAAIGVFSKARREQSDRRRALVDAEWELLGEEVRLLMSAHRWRQALKVLGEWAKENPTVPWAQMQMGEILLSYRDWAGAEDAFLDAVPIVRHYGDLGQLADIRSGIGEAAKRLGDLERAARHLQRSQTLRIKEAHAPDSKVPPELNRNLGSGHNDLSSLYGRLGRHDEAIAEAEAARAIFLARAEKWKDRSEEQNSLANAELTLGVSLYDAGRIDEARAAFQRSLAGPRMKSGNPSAMLRRLEIDTKVLHWLADIATESKDHVGSVDYFRRAVSVWEHILQLRRGEFRTKTMLAVVKIDFAEALIRAGRTSDAIAQCEESIVIQRSYLDGRGVDASWTDMLGATLVLLGDALTAANDPRAADTYAQARAIWPLGKPNVPNGPLRPRAREFIASMAAN